MKHTALAKRYARALVDLTDSAAGSQRLSEELRAVAGVHALSAEWREVMSNPAFASSRRAVVEGVAEALNLAVMTRRALHYLVERGRIGHLSAIVEAVDALLEAKTGRLKAQVLTPQALPKDRLERIRAALERITGRLIVVEEVIDSGLIGGVAARVGSVVYDGSLRAQITRFKTSSAKES